MHFDEKINLNELRKNNISQHKVKMAPNNTMTTMSLGIVEPVKSVNHVPQLKILDRSGSG